MDSTVLKVLMTLFLVQILIKVYFFFFVDYAIRRKQLDKTYVNKRSATKFFDNGILVILALLIVLLFTSANMEYLSFITGVYIGATLIQVYFHRFSEPLPDDKAPEAPVSPIKILSYAIQAFPKKPWKELLFLTAISLWGLYMLLTKGFGLF